MFDEDLFDIPERKKLTRVENDYYATSNTSTEALLNVEKFIGSFLEPCVGGGHIVEVIKNKCMYTKLTCLDLIDRGYCKETIVADFLTYDFKTKFDSIVTNPPYSLTQEFIEKSLDLLTEGGKVAMFLNLQFVESEKRKSFFSQHPPKIIYVFSNRQKVLRGGLSVDLENEKLRSKTTYAWFVWYKDFEGETTLKWL